MSGAANQSRRLPLEDLDIATCLQNLNGNLGVVLRAGLIIAVEQVRHRHFADGDRDPRNILLDHRPVVVGPRLDFVRTVLDRFLFAAESDDLLQEQVGRAVAREAASISLFVRAGKRLRSRQ
jgi:hypothetical protein